MKHMSKVTAVLAALFLAVAFTGCKNADDADDADAVAVYTATNTWEDYDGTYTSTMTAKFYGDGTFVVSWTEKFEYDGEVDEDPIPVFMKGTYTGDPSKDGTIKLTVTHEFNGEEVEALETPKTVSITVTGGKATYDGYTFTRK